MITYLISKDSKGEIRLVTLEAVYNTDSGVYSIYRKSGLLKGTMIDQPTLTISKGKAKRTIHEQCVLEYNALVKKQLDKGYKELFIAGNDYKDISEEKCEELLGDVKTNQSGCIKPMLAKKYQDVPSKLLNRMQGYYVSRKLDGVRCLMYWNGSEVVSSSRGGGASYMLSTKHIRENERLIEFFKKFPSYILDGELYIHGTPLQTISGLARLEASNAKTEQLQYWIYDFYDSHHPDLIYSKRDTLLSTEIKNRLTTSKFDINSKEPIIVLPQQYVVGWPTVLEMHDKFVAEGFEGIIARMPKGKYGVGKRSSDLIKVKKYQDDEFEIIGYTEGLRPEDMVFNLKTKDGKFFEAKPIGGREQVDKYRKDMKKLIGKMATVKYFAMSNDGVPTQPIFKSIRGYGE